ncbi:16739_t:CDS:2 [Funneliformis caledonium]|uniref:16739_t:CDS:1 n=1 Tax=Funneliformis caledonium TaxID=1117310 RepID=A0A9N9J9Z8_9GLOM|nr:16739_t:CDS:2 [Funneliformis caledonium]
MLPQKLGKVPQNLVLPAIPTFITVSTATAGAILGIRHMIKSEVQINIELVKSEVKNIIEPVKFKMEQISEKLDKLEGTVNKLEGTVNKLEGTVNKLEGIVDVLKVDMNFMKGILFAKTDQTGPTERTAKSG